MIPGQSFSPNKEKQITSYLKKLARKGKYYSAVKAADALGVAQSTIIQKAAKLNLDMEAVKSPEHSTAVAKLKKFLKDKTSITKAALNRKIAQLFKVPAIDKRQAGSPTARSRARLEGQTANDIWQKIKTRNPDTVPKNLQVKSIMEIEGETSGSKPFENWLRKKLKGRKTPLQITTFKELIKESGINIDKDTAKEMVKRNPELAEKIEWKYTKHAKGQNLSDQAYEEPHSKFKKWWENNRDVDYDKTTQRNQAHGYDAFKAAEDLGPPPEGYIRGRDFAEKMGIKKMSTLSSGVTYPEESRPAQYLNESFKPKIFNGKYYWKNPTVYEVRAWHKFRDRSRLDNTTIEDVKLVHRKFKNEIKNEKSLPTLARVQEALGNKSPTAATIRMGVLARLYSGEQFRGLENISKDVATGKRLTKQLSTGEYRKEFIRTASRNIDKYYKGHVGTLSNFARTMGAELNELLGKGHGFNINEITSKSLSEMRGTHPWAAFVDITEAKINQGPLAQYQGQLSSAVDHIEDLLNQGKDAEAVRKAEFLKTSTAAATKKTLATKYNLSPSQVEQINLADIIVSEKVDPKIYSPEQLARWKKKGLDIKTFAKDRGWYFDVKGGTPFWEADINKLITSAVNDEDNVCMIFRKAAATGGVQKSGCGPEMRKALMENADETVGEISKLPAEAGGKTKVRTIARQLLSKIPKGGRLGAILAGAGAVGAGTWAMMGDATAEEAPTTDQMTYNATEGKFVDAQGDPEPQEGILNWIADNPIKSGLAPIPVGMGVGLGADAMKAHNVAKFFTSMKFMLPPAYAAEKLYQYKQGQDLGEMFTNPLDAVWAMALDNKTSRNKKWNYYKNIAQKRVGIGPLAKGAVEAQQLGLKNLDPRRWKETGSALKRATMAPRSFGTSLVFPFAKGPAPATMGRGMAALRAGSRLLPLGPIPMALMAGSMAWDKYKFNKKVGDHVDALRSQGVVSEEDAQSMNTIYKQGWLGTTAIGAKLLGSEELMLDGELADIDKQKEVLAKMKEFYGGREEIATKERVGERQEDFFTWFSKGGRVGLKEGGNKKPFGSMTRRTFLKWLVGSIATGVAALSGKGLKQAAKTTTATVAKTPAKFVGVEGMPAWFPRAVAKIKAHGKLIEMADKHYVGGDMYEMMIPVKIRRSLSGRKGHDEIVMEQRKVSMEDNPLTGEISMNWTGTDNFGDDAVRQINFTPGKSGYQKFGVDPEYPQAWEYQRVKVEEPEFSYTQPDQSNPYRDDIEYLDIFEEGDEIVEGLAKMTEGKSQMVTKDGNVINTSEYGPSEKVVDKEFQKKIFKDIEGEDALVPDPEGKVGPEGDWLGDAPNEMIEGDIPDWVPKDKLIDPTKKAEGGIIETGNIARRPGAVPPLSGPTPQGRGILGLFSSPKRVNIT